jgi:hypothetical protein
MSEKKDYNQMRAPRPVVGACQETGEWKKPDMKAKCVECVSEPGFYGENRFYCAGKCMSEFDTNKICSTKSLVAQTVSQCDKPCFQTAAPSVKAQPRARAMKIGGEEVGLTTEQSISNIMKDYQPSRSMASTRGFQLFIGI